MLIGLDAVKVPCLREREHGGPWMVRCGVKNLCGDKSDTEAKDTNRDKFGDDCYPRRYFGVGFFYFRDGPRKSRLRSSALSPAGYSSKEYISHLPSPLCRPGTNLFSFNLDLSFVADQVTKSHQESLPAQSHHTSTSPTRSSPTSPSHSIW
jgi:hypothetical protein